MDYIENCGQKVGVEDVEIETRKTDVEDLAVKETHPKINKKITTAKD